MIYAFNIQICLLVIIEIKYKNLNVCPGSRRY